MKVKMRRFSRLKNALQTKDRPRPGRCNFPTENGRTFCKLSAGKFTAHPGSGYCKKHDKTGYDPIHRYRSIKQKDIRKQLRVLLETERDTFDLIPEITLMRALMIDYVERFYEFREALLAWYREERLKPKGVVDITEAVHHIEAVSRMIERHHRIQQKGSIDLATFERAMEEVGIIVSKHVRSTKILEAIETDWGRISLDSKTPMSLPPAQTVEHVTDHGETS